MSRRFLLLAGVLVTLNVALWLTPVGLALRQVALPSLFGKSMVRAQILESNGTTWRVDRGVVLQATGSLLTLREADGAVQPIAVAPGTSVVFNGRNLSVSSLARGWKVLVTWPANGTADLIKVEARRGSARSGGAGKGHSKG